MDKFSELRAFAAVVESGGFASAARDLGQSRSSVNRLVIALEDRLGVQLLHRTTRAVSATSTGERIYQRAKAVLEDIAELELSAGKARTEPVGRLRISAPPTIGTPDFSELIIDFMKSYPELEVEATFDTRIVDPVADGFDVVIRSAIPDEETHLVDHRVFTFDYLICASRAYINAHGAPKDLEALRAHKVLYQGKAGFSRGWELLGPKGAVIAPVRPVLTTNSLATLLQGVRAGLGISIIPAHEVAAEVLVGEIVQVLPEYSVGSRELQVIYPPARYLPAKVRLFTEFIAARCKEL